MTSMRIATGLAVAFAVLSTTVAARASTSSGIDGVYRVTWTQSELLVRGAPARFAHENCPAHCVLTMTLKGGLLHIRWQPPPDCSGTYEVSNNTVSIRETQHCRGLVVAHWTLTGRQLRLNVTTATDVGDRILFGGKPWRRIG